METQEQYNKRVAKREGYFQQHKEREQQFKEKERRWKNRMFTPVTDKAEAQEILTSIERGKVARVMTELNEFYAENGAELVEKVGAFIVSLNKLETDPFFKHKTSSLYSSLGTYIRDNNLKGEWRLVKEKVGEDEFLAIAKL